MDVVKGDKSSYKFLIKAS